LGRTTGFDFSSHISSNPLWAKAFGSSTVRTNGKQGQFGSTSKPRKITANRLQGSSRENWQKLRAGPLELINGRENAKAVRKREVRAQYLNNLLLDAPSFRADAINGRLMSFQCYKKLATWSRRQYYDTWL
jgi:hypothetical protein